MGGPHPKVIIEVMEDVLSKNEGGRAGPKREPDVDVYPLSPRVAQEQPSRGPHRAEAEGVKDVRFHHKRGPPQAVHNGHGRIHGGISYRKLLTGNA